MAFKNLFQSNMEHFAKLCKEHGWTQEETLKVIKAVQKDVNDEICKGHFCNVNDILKKHVIPVIERKRREQEQQNK